ncbi:MAG: Sporulation inhibitor [Bacilli bacterium]|nr:Sporulation inhibitor [Bacilli bacterium]
MQSISDEFLLEAYFSAVDNKLDPLFIQLLEEEIHRRDLNQNKRKVS